MADNTTSFFSQIRNEDGSGQMARNLCMGCMEFFDAQFYVCPHCGYVVGTPAEEPVLLAPGTVLNDRYYIGKSLGHGSFGVTYIGWDAKLEQKVAIKEFLPSEFSTRMPGKTQITVLGGTRSEQFLDGMRKFIDEAKRLAKFQNEPGIVKVFDSFEENSTAYIIMEMLEGMTLTELLKNYGTIEEDQAVEMLMPVMQSLEVVHKEGIIHRDISPDNIFVCNTGEVKLLDFGAARYATTSHTRTITTIIKPGYSPEEQYRSSNDQGPHTDVYALGATLYRMVTGKTPPDGLERRTMYETKGKDLLVNPAEYRKDLSRVREVAILNAMNIQISDRTPDVATFIEELGAEVPARRLDGKIKKLPTYRWPKWLKIAVPVAAALVSLFVVLLVTGVIRFSRNENEEIVVPDRFVTVPNIERKTEAEAIRMLEDKKLRHQMGEGIISEYCEPGCIIYQDYLPGAYIEEGDVVTYKVCVGNGKVQRDGNKIIIPFLKGLKFEDGKKMLADAGLVVEYEEVYYDSEAGLIISSDPVEDTRVDVGSKIVLKVSKGPEPFVLKLNVVGMKEEKAIQALIDIELARPEITYEPNDAEKGTVLAQSVAVGETVTKGQKITLTVSAGPEEKLVEIPDVKNKAENEAKSILEAAGFKVSVSNEYSSSVPKGYATRTNPKAGNKRLQGEFVVLFISSGTGDDKYQDDQKNPQDDQKKPGKDKSVTIPDVVGSPEAKAKSTLESKGLKVSIGNAYSDSVAKGNVISTSPAAGKKAAKGDTVKMTVSLGKEPPPEAEKVTVPDVAGSTKDKALKTLKLDKYAFNVSVKEEYSPDVKAGSATRTSPAAGTTVEKGSSIELYISKGGKQYTVTFNANGGSVDEPSRIVSEGSKLGTLPTPVRTYFKFAGWYDNSSASGLAVTASDIMGGADLTLYAGWTENPLSDWVSEYDIPSGADVMEEKWKYTYTEYKDSSQSTMAGWEYVDKSTSYGSWSGWSTTPVSASSTVDVETKNEQVHTGYNMVEFNYATGDGRYYCKYRPNTSAYIWERWRTVSVDHLNHVEQVAPGGWSKYGSRGRNDGGETGYVINVDSDGEGIIYFISSNIYENQTFYHWRSITTTYRFKRDSEMESSTPVSAGGNISNVRRYVKYKLR